MDSKYLTPRMELLWSPQVTYNLWLKVELFAVEARFIQGEVSEKEYDKIFRLARIDVARIKEIEERMKHNVNSFLAYLSEVIGPSARVIHQGLTSYDVIDTALSFQLVEACKFLEGSIAKLIRLLKKKAFEYREMVCVGRTHGVHAEPMSFGHKYALWAFDMADNLAALREARKGISVGKLSGAIGTYSNIDPEIERYVCQKMGLKPVPANQVISRDRHARLLSILAVCAGTIEKISTEIRLLQQTEIREVEEHFGKDQKGSSAMPHKKNPEVSERLCSLAKNMRSYQLPAQESQALWHERDLTNSAVERTIFFDSTTTLDYMLNTQIEVLEGLRVFPLRMMQNLNLTGGLVFSSRVLDALIEKGLDRERAYAIVQRNAMVVWENGGDFTSQLLNDPEFTEHVGLRELDELFNVGYYLRRVGKILDQLKQLTSLAPCHSRLDDLGNYINYHPYKTPAFGEMAVKS